MFFLIHVNKARAFSLSVLAVFVISFAAFSSVMVVERLSFSTYESMEEKSSFAAGVFFGLNVVPLSLEGVVKLT